MKGLSESLPSLRIRLLAACLDALAVASALLVSLAIDARSIPALPVLQASAVLAAGTMLCVAILSFFLSPLFAQGPRQTGSTVGVRVILSGLLMALAHLPYQHADVSMTPIMYGLSYFVAATLLHSFFDGQRDARNCTGATGHNKDDGTLRTAPYHIQALPPADPSQLLGRDELPSQMDAANVYADRVVLITGAGGSIGSELSHQVLACRPRKIVLFELSESALYHIHQTMLGAAAGTNIEILPMLGSVTDARKVRRTLQDHGVQVVLHAAAYKHVPLVELNPLAGLHNNVEGTETLATQSVETGVERFVLISSDKAVRPINVMGASKRLCELVVQDFVRALAGRRAPVFSIVRFGNVLGSSGSVLPLFYDQVSRGGPVTVTHPDVSRFFMTAREAVQLVLHAGSLARGGEVFVLDMGAPVRIEDLARRVIQSVGLQVRDQDNPEGDVEIKFIGLRRGEKLTEELTMDGRRISTSHPRIFTAVETGLSQFEVAAALRAMRQALACNDEAGVRANACGWVAGFGGVDGNAPDEVCPEDVTSMGLSAFARPPGKTHKETRLL